MRGRKGGKEEEILRETERKSIRKKAGRKDFQTGFGEGA